jgi:hypothetical protein
MLQSLRHCLWYSESERWGGRGEEPYFLSGDDPRSRQREAIGRL